MRQRALVRVGVLALAVSPLHAQTPSIQHQAVGCVVAEKFPRLEARFSPGDTVATARVLFQTETTQAWYAVAMKADGVSFVGVLPKPKKSLQTFRYYIEVTDRSMGTSRTSDYTTAVVTASTACKGKGIMAGALGSATVLLQAPVGAAALPVGFASSGVVAAGSGAAAGATLRALAVASRPVRSSASSVAWERSGLRLQSPRPRATARTRPCRTQVRSRRIWR